MTTEKSKEKGTLHLLTRKLLPTGKFHKNSPVEKLVISNEVIEIDKVKIGYANLTKKPGSKRKQIVPLRKVTIILDENGKEIKKLVGYQK